ncbi:MAG: MBOAT family protein [Clostridia bacterium]|nr:MBOAT family protein [Clostridia bacterium]
MVFSSLIFIFFFLNLTLGLYYMIPKRIWRNCVLFVMSLIFYGWGEPVYILVMIFSVTSAFLLGFFISKYRESNIKLSRLFLIISVCVSLALLFFFKYFNFVAENLMLLTGQNGGLVIEGLKLPIGISFYTFQIMSYSIDLYRGDANLQKNYVSFGTYVTLFPQLIAGPIVRYKDVDAQLNGRTESVALFASGVRRFITGMSKKVLIGDGAAAVYEYFKSASGVSNTVAGAWMIMLCFTIHIYYDFSGYSDMAIGLGRMFGFRFLENFDYPYISTTISEFWRRWHISLGTWFREYVYIPLGGNRNGKLKQLRNLAIVWLLTGFWHGANWNYIIWGVYYGIILIAEKMFLGALIEKLPRILRHVYTLFLVGVGWIIFSFTDAGAGFDCFRALFGSGCDSFTTATVTYQILRALPLMIVAILGCTPLPKKLWDRLCTVDWTAEGKLDSRGKPVERSDGGCPSSAAGWVFSGIGTAGSLFLFVLSVAYLVNSSFSPFLYFIF